MRQVDPKGIVSSAGLYGMRMFRVAYVGIEKYLQEMHCEHLQTRYPDHALWYRALSSYHENRLALAL